MLCPIGMLVPHTGMWEQWNPRFENPNANAFATTSYCPTAVRTVSMRINSTSSLLLSHLSSFVQRQIFWSFPSNHENTGRWEISAPLALLLLLALNPAQHFLCICSLLHHLHLSLASLAKWTTHASAKLALCMLRHCALRLRLLSLALLFLLFRPHHFLRPSVPRRQYSNLAHSRYPSKSCLRSRQPSIGLLERRRKNLA